jgi:hypothetical protein
MDRIFALTLFTLALACFCIAALLSLAGFIDWLIQGRWPDQSVLRLAYDSGLLRARFFLSNGWSLPVRDLLARLPAALVAVALAPLCWWLGGMFARR